MEATNSLKHYETIPDSKGEYRTYTVYKKEGLFVFECLDCTLRQDGGFGCTRKAYSESSTQEQAVAEYEQYIDAWEPKR